MAEGIQLTSMNTKFYCYRCDHDVSILSHSELTCPECSSGFIEEVPQDDFDDESDVDESELNMFNLFNVENLFRRAVVNVVGEVESPSQEPYDEADSSEEGPSDQVNSARRLLQELEDTLIEGQNSRLRNLGDYLFGDDIDALSTLLFNEAEILGPPPLSLSKIKLLPVITVSKEHVEKGVQCSICMEDFAIREKAKNLPCGHFYHEKCITPWLERHATCPNCRKTVEVVERRSKNQRSRSCPRSFEADSIHVRFVEPRPSLGTIITATWSED